MRKAEAQKSPVQSRPTVRQGNGAALESPQGEQIVQLEAMANNSAVLASQRKLIGQIHGSPAMAAQRRVVEGIDNLVAAQRQKAHAKPNNTGLPDSLKSGIESLSGMSMDSVKVHYNSSQPAQLNALAYAQGADIHVAPGQEQHVPHEAWHVVQQAQGRVKPTMQMKDGVQVNDEQGLEHEADVMGGRASSSVAQEKIQLKAFSASHAIVQRAVAKENERTNDNSIAGKMDYSFKWQASDPHHNGFIIQMVDRTEAQTIGDGDPVVINNVYWEAWKVVNGVIFNGDQDISGIQHDSWFNAGMPASSHGTIQMDCNVYFSTAEALEGMAANAVAMAGNLLSSQNEPGAEKAQLFNHSHTFNWDRRLLGEGNITAIITAEMRSSLELSGEENQTFAQMSAAWDDDEWNDFLQNVNRYDPGNGLTLESLKERVATINL